MAVYATHWMSYLLSPNEVFNPLLKPLVIITANNANKQTRKQMNPLSKQKVG